METLRQDLSYSARSLLKNPAFTLIAVLSLAIGIGATSAIFSVTNSILLRPLPYRDAERLVIIWNRSPGLGIAQDWFSPAQHHDIKTQNHVFEDTAVTIGGSFNLTGQGAPERVDGARVSSSLFPLLGARASMGRVFTADEDTPGKPQTVILSHGFWQRRFGSDPSVVGKTLTLNGNSLEIVGVMTPDFSLDKEVMLTVNAIERADVLLPLPMNEGGRTDRDHEDYNIFARLKPGVTVAQAQAEMDVISERVKRQYPDNYPPHGGLTFSVVPLLEEVVGDIRLILYVLFGAVGFVLVVACANVANLLLARGAARQKEIAIRTAVGASRARILRQLLTESVLLSLAGGLFGLLVAYLGVRGLRAYGPENIPRLGEVGVDMRVLLFTFAVSLMTGVVFGLVPALRASRVDLNEVLKEGGRSLAGGGSAFGMTHHRLRKLLVIAEVALSLVLLIGAGLLVRSYREILNAHPGYNPRNVLSLRLALPANKYPKPEAIGAFYREMHEKIKQLPGVEAVGVSYSLPMSTVAFAWEPIIIEGYQPPGSSSSSVISNTRIVSPDYFRVMEIPLLKGRYFTEQDKMGAPEAVIVDEQLAARFWPNESALGKRLQQRNKPDSWKTVVGVISSARQYSTEKEPPITVYYPHEQYMARNMYVLVRTTSDPASLAGAVTREIQSIDSELPIFDINTMEQRLYDSLARQRFSMMLLALFAAVALVLALIGIYGVMTYWVNQRVHEIGIRMALGAQPGNILRLVIRQALLLVSVGIAAGLAGAFALTRIMSSLLFNVSATDRLTFALLPLLLAGIALLSSYIPARRAARVDPMIALRYE
ncbi:MAG TPA: ABC transporter permease [Pyrinomonadaceae bacterium]|nr:ABC transporter permease [Pyrinomonadaceae bacterium]